MSAIDFNTAMEIYKNSKRINFKRSSVAIRGDKRINTHIEFRKPFTVRYGRGVTWANQTQAEFAQYIQRLAENKFI